MNNRLLYIALVSQECKRRELDSKLICALIETESSFNTYAMRYEPESMTAVSVSAIAKQNRITEATEQQCQKFSWGLGQVLGSTARWLGYKDPLPALCDPKQGIYWCCEAFQKLGNRYSSMEEKIAAYNAGSARRKKDGTFVNQSYVDKVLNYYNNGKY